MTITLNTKNAATATVVLSMGTFFVIKLVGLVGYLHTVIG